ncbi:unnamed protein product [Parajaminaea phylloscopi]
MSATAEKRAEDSVKSAHKKEKTKRQRDGGAVAGSDDAAPQPLDDEALKREKKKRKKEEKAAKKAAKAAAAAAPEPVASTSAQQAPAKINGAPTDAAAANAFLQENNITLETLEESTDRPPLPFLSFSELRGKVSDGICDELDRLKFQKPTPIQACCWPVLLSDKDVVGIAETGSGKTFAFGVPALQHLVATTPGAGAGGKKGKKAAAGAKASPQVSVLVIAPTRELAKQTHDNLLMLAPSLGFGSVCLFGGVPKYEQLKELNGSPAVRIVVGTPGRVLDLAREGSLDLSGVDYLVLDEADRMLDKGFEPDIRAIIGMTRSREEGRHTSMFSATWPAAVRGLAETFMKDPVRVTVGSDELTANRRIEQRVEVIEDSRAKERRLNAVLRELGAGPRGKNAKDKVLIFALYKKEASRIEENLRRGGYAVSAIHGDMTQPQRMASLESFKSGETPLLVATDVAARGLDIPAVTTVINVTFPLTADEYVHRIGRTGRAGKTGVSITFFTAEDKAHAGELQRILRDADQPVPDELKEFGSTIKKKTHSAYGDHFRELAPGKAKKITFD